MANELLVRGAGLVAQSEGVGKLAKSKAFSDIGKDLSTGLGKMFQARNREFNRILANQLNKDSLSEEQKDELYDELEKKRFRYVYLNDRRLRGKLEESVGELASNITDVEDRKNKLAISSQSTNGNLPSLLQDDAQFHISNKTNTEVVNKDGTKGVIISNSENSQSFSQAFAEARANNKKEFTWNGKMYHTKTKEELQSQNNQLDKKPEKKQPSQNQQTGDGTYSYESETETMNSSVAQWYKEWSEKQEFYKAEYTDDSNQENDRKIKELGMIDVNNLPEDLQFVTHEEFIDMINGYAPDENSESAFQGHIDKTIQNAKNIKPGEKPDFNWSIEYDKMKTFTAKGNAKAIWNNPILGGRVPKDDLINSIKSGTYSDYGIGMTEKDAKQLDPTKDTPITDDDARIIADEIINNQPELRSNLLAEYLTNLSGDIYKKSLDQDVLRGISMVDSEILGTSQSQFDAEFMTQQEQQQKLQEIENQKLNMSQNQGDQGDQSVFNPELGIDQFNVDNNNNNQNQKSYTTNYTEMSNLSVVGDGPGKANILENGRAITANIGPFGAVSVDGVKVSGTDIIVDSSVGEMGFGRFKLENGKYKWYPDQTKTMGKTPMQWFKGEGGATEAQKKAFDKFINAVETDKKYADALMKHIQGGKGGINAGTLQNIT